MIKLKISATTIFFLFLIGCKEDYKFSILDSGNFIRYIESFNQNDNELYSQYVSNDSAFQFLSENIPLIEIPDKNIEETYYFRWWTFRKHIKSTEDGFVVTEFLPDVPWSGKHNTINCPAGHQIYEGRWLRDPKYISDYIHFWLYKSGEGLRQYSFWVADATFAFYKVHKNDLLLTNQLEPLLSNYEQWEKIRRDTLNILFWQNNNQEGMEFSASGRVLNSGVPIWGVPAIRPSMNSYMYGDAKAIASIAKLANNQALSESFESRAISIKQEVQNRLWNKELNFFTVLPKTFAKTDHPVDVRELIGYTPWYFNLPDDKITYSNAWNKIKDTTGFYAPYGLTVCERSHSFFEINYSGHECQWNGPSWPYATTQTLKGLSNLLNYYTYKGNVSKEDYFDLISQYARSHSIKTEKGENQKWIDENLNPFTGDWISRTRLKSWNNGTWSHEKGGVERGKDYNHSGFCDLIISDLLGFKPRVDNIIEINPLIPNNWDWFCLDKVRYHERELTVIWDRTGEKYNKGNGLLIFVDGILKAKTNQIERLIYRL